MSFDIADDIDAAFDSIVLVEDNLVQSGFKEGYLQGAEDGEKEGFLLGLDKGSQIGQEIGFYAGFGEGWHSHLSSTPELQTKNKRVLSQLEKLLKLIESVPEINQQTVDISDTLENIRSKFKTICSMLNFKQEQSTEISW